MARTGRRTAVVALMVTAMMLVGQAMALAGPKGPPDFGVKNPQGLNCSADSVKCMTAGWRDGGEVHIVDDPLEGEGDASGHVIFWCQSVVGFKYQISVEGLAPKQVFTVTTAPMGPGDPEVELGTFRTDPRGYGTLNGVLPLPEGHYGYALIVTDAEGDVVLDSWGDGQFFGVYGS